MKTQVFLFHTRLSSSRTNRAWMEKAAEAGISVRDVMGLTQGGPVDVDLEQGLLEAADRVVLQFPLNWYGGPWIFKRWIDEVLTYGWAYGDRYALRGKPIALAVAVGGPADTYGPASFRRHSVEEFLRPIEGNVRFVEGTYCEPFLCYGTGSASDEQVAQSAIDYVRWLSDPSWSVIP